MKFQIGIIVFILFTGVFYSCKKENVYPIEPAISMSPDQTYLNPATITISFTDGDGDVGLSDADTVPPYQLDLVNFNKYYYNLLLYYFVKNGDVWEEADLIVPFYYRIPDITPSGQNKTLKGDIEVSITLPINRPDSIRFNIELIDRALHSSNILTTPVIYK